MPGRQRARYVYTVVSLPALRSWVPAAERGPSLESCEGNKIISFKKIMSPQPLKKKKNPGGGWARAQCAHWLRRPFVYNV